MGMRAQGQDSVCMKTGTLAIKIPQTGLHKSTRLVIGFRHPFPTYFPKNHASWLPKHNPTHDEYNDLLSKEHKSLKVLPLTIKEMTFFRQKLTFQLFSTTEIL